MLRAILLISVLYTARAFPVSGDNPDPSRYTLREEEVDDVEDANEVLEKAGLKNCDMDGYKPHVAVGGCACVSKDGGVHFMGVYKNEEEQPESLEDLIEQVKPCELNGDVPEEVPPEGCKWIDQDDGIHLSNVLNDVNGEFAIRALRISKLYRQCVVGQYGPIIPKGGCVVILNNGIHIMGMQGTYTQITQDDDEENLDYKDYEDYSDRNEDDVSNVMENLVGKRTDGKIYLQKGLFNRRSDDLAKTSAIQKKIVSGQKAHKNPSRKEQAKVDKTLKIDREPDQGRKVSSHKK